MYGNIVGGAVAGRTLAAIVVLAALAISAPSDAHGLEHFRGILNHLTAHQGPVGRRIAQRDVMHRASGATHQNGLGAPSNGPDYPGNALASESPPPAGLSALFGGPFSLMDHSGRPRTDKDFPGKFLLINFGYTRCPDICPLDLSTLAAALDMLEQAGERVQPLFITIDPARDKPAVLQGYVFKFHPRLIGLGGSEAQISRVAKAYRVHRSKVMVDDAPPQDYMASHSSLTFLMAPNGSFVTMFPHGTKPEFMADAIRRYILK
ncbi:MAG: SCO family protein [Alphaproteobacteria bacterium]|nr:SCO family protein [Alphaproteobacteria bacterium]